MSKRLFIGSWTAMLIGALVFAAVAVAAAPVVNEHANFTSDPVRRQLVRDRRHRRRQGGRALQGGRERSLAHETVNITDALHRDRERQVDGDSEHRRCGQSTAPIDNGDGTYSIIATNTRSVARVQAS